MAKKRAPPPGRAGQLRNCAGPAQGRPPGWRRPCRAPARRPPTVWPRRRTCETASLRTRSWPARRACEAACRVHIGQSQQPGEDRQRDHARQQPPDRLVEAEPRPERKASGNLGESRPDICGDRSHAIPLSDRVPPHQFSKPVPEDPADRPLQPRLRTFAARSFR